MKHYMYTFSEALDAMRLGDKVRRASWSEDEEYIRIVHLPEVDGIKVNPQFFIKNKSEGYSSYSPSACEILAEDWEIVHE